MSDKKSLSEGFGNLLERKTVKPASAKETARPEESLSEQELERRRRTGRRRNGDDREKLTANLMYTSLAIDKDLYAKIRAIAQINGLPYKDLLNAALSKYIELYEKRHGPVDAQRENGISAESLI